MLKFNFHRLFLARGISKPFTFLLNQGFSSNTSSKLINKQVKGLRLSQVEKLCILFDCTPNDLLEWEPGNNISVPEEKALSELIRKDNIGAVSSLLYQVPINELDDVAEFLKSKIEKK